VQQVMDAADLPTSPARICRVPRVDVLVG